MSQQINNPFSPASSDQNGFSSKGVKSESQPKVSGNPFHALEQAAEARSPFAAASGNFPDRSDHAQSGRPTKLPEPRSNDQGNGNVHQFNEVENVALSPFELVDTKAPQPTAQPSTAFQSSAENFSNQPSQPAAMPAQPLPTPQPQFSIPPQADAYPPAQSWDQAPQAYYQPSQNAPIQPRFSGGSTIRQLELRAIFGVNHELSGEEILQRARTLPGVRNLSLIDENGANAVSQLREHVSRLGFGDRDSLYLASSSGSIDFIEENGATLAVLYEGNFAPGVRETLIIVTRELAKLS